MTENICNDVVKITVGNYNSYLIMGGEKTALICACEEKVAANLLEKIDRQVDYIIFTGVEPSISGAAMLLFEKFANAEIIATGAAIRNLKQIFNREINAVPSRDGQIIALGGISLEVLVTPEIFNPDTMMIYLKDRAILFSGRAFSDVTPEDAYLHYPEFTYAMTERVSKINADKIMPCVGNYRPVELKREEKFDAAVFYYSASGYTKKLVNAVVNGLKSEDMNVAEADLAVTNDEQIKNLLRNCDKIYIGTPTENRGIPRKVWNLLSLIDPASSSDRGYFIFGSYGWSGEGVYVVNSALKALRMNSLNEPFRAAYNPTEDDLEKIYNIAAKIAREK